jgi:hypothetical protein
MANELPSPISISESVLVSLLAALFLILLGKILRRYLLEGSLRRLTGSLTYLENSCVDLAIGVSFLVVIITIMTPFHLLNQLSVLIIVIATIIIVIRTWASKKNIQKIFRMRILNPRNLSKRLLTSNSVVYILLTAIILITLLLRFQAINGQYAFSEMDIKADSLLTRAIIDQGGFTIFGTVKYGGSANWYFEGYNGIVAFFSLSFGLSPERTFTILGQLFAALVPLSLFVIGSSLFKDRRAGLFCALTAALSFFPMKFTWGGDAFIVGSFFLAIIIMVIFKSGISRSTTLSIGVLMGGLISIYPFQLVSLVAILVPYAILKAVFNNVRVKCLSLIRNVLTIIAIASLISIYTISQTAISFNQNVLPNPSLGVAPDLLLKPYVLPPASTWQIMLPKDLILELPASLPKVINAFSLWFDRGDVAIIPGSPVVSLVSLTSAFLALALVIALTNDNLRRRLRNNFSSGLICLVGWFIILFFVIQVNPLGLFPFNISVLSQNTDRLIFMSAWPVEIYIGFGLFLSVVCMQYLIQQTGLKIKIKKKKINKLRIISHAKAIGLILATLLVISYISISLNIIYDDSTYRFNEFRTDVANWSLLTGDDYALMLWMKSNIPSTAITFVSPADAGDFIPVITGLKIVYPWGYNDNSPFYQNIVNGLVSNPNNETLVQSLKILNVTYVYVGVKSYPPYNIQMFNATKFLNSNYYTLVASVGDASLFKVNYTP